MAHPNTTTVHGVAERGLVTAHPDRRGALEPVARRPGAVRRFLEERDEG